MSSSYCFRCLDEGPPSPHRLTCRNKSSRPCKASMALLNCSTGTVLPSALRSVTGSISNDVRSMGVMRLSYERKEAGQKHTSRSQSLHAMGQPEERPWHNIGLPQALPTQANARACGKPRTLVAMANQHLPKLKFDMKYPVLLIFFFIVHISYGQDKDLLQYKKYFDKDFKTWTATFSSFNLSKFKIKDTVPFDNNYEQNLDYYNEFLTTYKPIITYSPDSSKFIDIYSYQLNLVKKDGYYYANPDVDQTIFLFDKQKKYWGRIYFGTSSQWIDEVVWLSKTKFILVGITKSSDNKKTPLILIGDTDKQTLVRFLSTDDNSSQNDKGYSSQKLKNIKIKGL